MARNGPDKVALVVDDETFARLFAVQVFLDQGYTVIEAADAAEGLAALERNAEVSILFTDISMPGDMNGLDLVALVRELRPEIALLLTSGHSLAPGDSRASDVAFLAKPYSAHALLESVEQLAPARRAA